MPGIIDRLAAAEVARMLGDAAPVLADDDTVGVGVDLDRSANCTGDYGVFVAVEPQETSLRDRGWRRMEPIKAAAIGNELRPLLLENLPDRSIGSLGMGMRLGVSDAPVGEPSVQFVVGLKAQSRREEAPACRRPAL